MTSENITNVNHTNGTSAAANNSLPVSRRTFIQVASAGAAAGVAVAGCSGRASGGTGWIPQQYENSGNFPVQVRGRVPIDPNNPSIERDDKKCILCGQCAEVCEKIEHVHNWYETPLGDSYWHPFQNSHGISGHAFIGAVPFMTAAQMTDRPVVKGLFYTMSTFCAWSRIKDDAHYLSQALLGWYLAYLSVRSVSETEGLKPLPRGLTLFPVMDDNSVGFGFLYQR
ncbi:hypothetical protein FACS1894170_08630 [Planctomycetales bacterium]|nr:hypothetical protein FACS1894170_08630 [Planctomycetales bacterium]